MTTPVAPVTPVTPTVPTTPTAPVTPSPTTPDNKGLEFKIPEQYAKESWAQNLKSVDDIFKEHANAQILLGRKGVILPTDKSTPEEIQNFRKTLGVPDSPEGYEFQVIEQLKGMARDTSIDHMVKEQLHRNGVPKNAGEAIIKQLETMVYEQAKPRLEAQIKVEKDFSALKLATFGDKTETAQAQFDEVIGETLKGQEHLIAKYKELSPEGKTITMAFAKAMHDKYVGEHKITPPKDGSGSLSPDLKTAFNEISAAKLAVKNDKDMPKHVKTQRLQELNKKMTEIGAKASEANINLFG